jgi:hypothetical protein
MGSHSGDEVRAMSEKWYDEEIAPKLAEVAAL